MKAIKVSLCPETGIPLVPEEIKERVRNGEKIGIELMHGVSGFVKNALRHNCAGLWIDGCRIPTQEDLSGGSYGNTTRDADKFFGGKTPGGAGKFIQPSGRYPKNVIHDSSEEVLTEFAKAGVRKSGGISLHHKQNVGPGAKGHTLGKGWHSKTATSATEPSTGFADRYYQSCPPDDHCPTCNNTDVLPLDTSFEEWVKDTNGTREEYERLLKPGICNDCRKAPGRYPKNVIVDGSEEVKAEFDKAGVRKTGNKVTRSSSLFMSGHDNRDGIGYNETSTSASRFYQTCPSNPCPTCNGTKLCEVELSFEEFMNNPYEPPPEYEACPDCVICSHCFDIGVELPDEDIDDWEAYAKEHPCPECRSEEPVRFKYVSKSSKRERNRGLDGREKKPAQSTGWSGEGMPLRQDGTERKMPLKQNTNPCVKPLSLIRYLCKISRTPTGGIVLDPFLGSGTTSLAAFLEGRASIGIEQSAEYCSIAANRLAYEQSLDPEDRVK